MECAAVHHLRSPRGQPSFGGWVDPQNLSNPRSHVVVATSPSSSVMGS
jgi:hypothetical protein